MVQKGLLELVGRSGSDWAGDSATRQSVTGYHCDVQNVTTRNRSLKQTAVSLSSCEAEYHAASACARELLGLAELFKKLHYNVSVVSRWIQTRQDTFYRARDQADPNTLKYNAWQHNSGHERNVYL